MVDKAAPQATRPLTPAQIEVLEQMMEDRAARLHAQVTSLIADAVTPLEQTVTQLQQTVAQQQQALDALTAASLQYGQPVALRAHAGKLLCAAEGGPTADGETFVFVARPSAGPWESFVPERGSW